ncbi:hypothetical protein G6F46_005510 [Rhizopus delemar]|uniref:Uncharacterized protein n=2 Tax=Rhizopus TaxID=4842 RepID=A0A9P6Z0A7_9FUNG|nr:hypothetical protein G6F36_015365 [Rhizopus arrhizus]KAG1494681.1 hypothetical protein G6F54_007706 [Rhizopus delemar]KAG1508672.1 hypothetical protein G6F53_008014 [Rhizopus delemar]KAG1520620.1 hypothetical protein G6F52_007493 [Rhizopus delemar]KAG1544756.1 hypothetical protein G6F51_005867 [Rhizopus arrhizus]
MKTNELDKVSGERMACRALTQPDQRQHLETLRTRLGFAKFKLKNGWEHRTLRDVESLWKQKQQASIQERPMPQWTQQEVIEKRSKRKRGEKEGLIRHLFVEEVMMV